MKNLIVGVLLCSSAWPQIQTGSVVVFVLAPNQVTVAADSREVETGSGAHTDSSCKIHVFGDNFFFAMTGPTGHNQDAAGPGWTALAGVASAWQKATQKRTTFYAAQDLTNTVATEWIVLMKRHEQNPNAIDGMRKMLAGNTIASALFGSTDSAGNLGLTRADVFVDLDQFDKKKVVILTDDLLDRSKVELGGALGLNEIAREHMPEIGATVRQRRDLARSAQDAEIARQVVDMSIRTHPRKQWLGGSIDELQLTVGSGIQWINLKPNCRKKE